MWRISSSDAKGGTVLLAPFGTEDGPEPCLVWVDPRAVAIVRHCKVQAGNGELITAKTERGLRAIATRLGFNDASGVYFP